MTAKITAGLPPAGWRNRISGSGEEAPDQLLANPGNWRLHPRNQQNALAGALDTVGWVQQVMVNRRTGFVVDGHARVALAISRNEPSVPVLYVDLSPEEEALVLATLDPIGAMATADEAKLNELLAEVTVDDAGLLRLLGDLGSRRPAREDPDLIPEVEAATYVEPGQLWLLGDHRLFVGDATDAANVERLLDGVRPPRLLATDPPYGVSLDPTWRDGLYRGLGPAEKPYMRTEPPAKRRGPGRSGPYMTTETGPGDKIRFPRRSEGHRNTTLSGDTRVDWSDAYALVPKPRGRLRLARRRIRRRSRGRSGADRLRDRVAGDLGQGPVRDGPVLVSLGPRAVLGDPQAGRPQSLPRRPPSEHDLAGAQPEDDHGRLDRGEVRPSGPKAGGPVRDPDPQSPRGGRGGLRRIPGLRHDPHRGRSPRPALPRDGDRPEVLPDRHRALAELHGPSGRSGSNDHPWAAVPGAPATRGGTARLRLR